MGTAGMLVLGIIIIIAGLVNMSGNISIVHSYNRKNVAEKDIPKYGKTIGIGTIVIGMSLIAAYLLKTFTDLSIDRYITGAGFIIGMAVILFAQFKYNKGIF